MRLGCAVLGLLLVAATAAADDEAALVLPYEGEAGFAPAHALDRCVLAGLASAGIEPSPRCSDAVFLRRVHLDLLGLLPTPQEVDRFLADRRPDKRARLVDRLLADEAFVDLWTMRFADMLRVKSEFPIRLWPNGVQAYHRWLREAIVSNMPLDELASALLTSSGSNFRTPAVNFWRAVEGRAPDDLAAVVALTFLGERTEHWPPSRQRGLAALLAHVVFKPTAEWKEEIVMEDPAPRAPFEAVLPDGRTVQVPPDEDPRRVLARWLVRPDNPALARAMANRVWAWLLGRGVAHPPDDLGPHNPPANAALLTCLARELQDSDYDLRHLLRVICTSRTYQGSSIPRSRHPQTKALFGVRGVRRLGAEVLLDALCRLDGRGATYQSAVPEPFTILPDLDRAVRLEDGTITSPFLEMFGRPARDTGHFEERNDEVTAAQLLHLLNATDVQRRIERGAWLAPVVRHAARDPRAAVGVVYRTLLSRPPTPDELAIAAGYFAGEGRSPAEAAHDLVWALINGKEFLYHH